MFNRINRRTTAVLMAMAIVISNVIAPISPAFADGGKQVYCNIEGSSGKWKAQISNGNTEHEFKLPGVFVHDQSKVTPEMDAQCAQLFNITLPDAPAPNLATCDTAGSLSLVDTNQYTWSTKPVSADLANIGPGTYDITATVKSGVGLFSNGKTSVTFKNIVVDAQQDGPQCHQPAPLTTYSEWVDQTPYTCGDTTVTQTRTKTVTPYTWNGTTWVLDTAHAVTTTETQTRVPTSDELARCTKPADYTTTSTKTATICLPGGGGKTTTWTTVNTYTYIRFFNKWVSVLKSSSTTDQTVDASEADCPTSHQVNPTCDTLGSLTLPAYTDGLLRHHTYNVWVNGIKTTYSADSDAVVANIPQGATVKVELVITGAPQWVPALYSHTFTFTSSDCNVATPATPVKPQITDCKAILPITAGITYQEVYLDSAGNIIVPGVNGAIAAGQGVLATANQGFYLDPSDDNGQFVNDHTGYLYTLDLTGMSCGKGDVTPPVTTPTDNGVLPHTTAPRVTELPHTGASLNGMVIALFAALSTYGIVYFAQPKRR